MARTKASAEKFPSPQNKKPPVIVVPIGPRDTTLPLALAKPPVKTTPLAKPPGFAKWLKSMNGVKKSPYGNTKAALAAWRKMPITEKKGWLPKRASKSPPKKKECNDPKTKQTTKDGKKERCMMPKTAKEAKPKGFIKWLKSMNGVKKSPYGNTKAALAAWHLMSKEDKEEWLPKRAPKSSPKEKECNDPKTKQTTKDGKKKRCMMPPKKSTRAPSAYALWLKSTSADVVRQEAKEKQPKLTGKERFSYLSKAAAAHWKQMSQQEKRPYVTQSMKLTKVVQSNRQAALDAKPKRKLSGWQLYVKTKKEPGTLAYQLQPLVDAWKNMPPTKKNEWNVKANPDWKEKSIKPKEKSIKPKAKSTKAKAKSTKPKAM